MEAEDKATTLDSAIVDSTSGDISYSYIAPTPISIAQTGVSEQLLKDLLLKHIYDAGVISTHRLSERLCLSGTVIEKLIYLLREEALIELSSSIHGDGTLSFKITERGRYSARDALDRSGYLGPAPVSINTYKRISSYFSLSKHTVEKKDVVELFKNFVIDETLLDQMGAAFNSRKAIFVYGPAGTGKTYTIGKMMELFHDNCLIPHAIAVDESIIQMFDAQVHHPVEDINKNRSLHFSDSHDSRFVLCQRPVIVSGGELTADLLEVQIDPRSKVNQAPLQLKANNGVFLIDDIGRQSIAPAVIFNRWIVPMEEGRDFLSLAGGQHFESPFDVQLVFSSNINPLELADAAALRRIGFKILFNNISPESYTKIWEQEITKNGLEYNRDIVTYTLDSLHRRYNTPLLPCHPRDLINMAKTQSTYSGRPKELCNEDIEWAWNNYFVNLKV